MTSAVRVVVYVVCWHSRRVRKSYIIPYLNKNHVAANVLVHLTRFVASLWLL